MATSKPGYRCEFIDSVCEDLYCKKCALVARRLTVAMCCGESFCHDCLVDSRQQDKSCPACGGKNFTTFEQMKLQKRINCLRVYCSMKERGCGWAGPLEQLDAHLNPDLNNCQYVDTKCPLNCPLAVPKNKVEQHVDKECVKRAFTCQHCDFKATYEEVVDTHLTECKYIPLQCPNMCGVTCEREVMEDHMKICRLEDVECEFKGVGCDNQFRREDQEEYVKQNSHKHLVLTASVAVETKQQLQQKMNKVEKKIEVLHNLSLEHTETIKILRSLAQQQDKKVSEQKRKMEDQERKWKDQEKKMENQKKEMRDQERKLKVQEKKIEDQENKMDNLQKKLKEQEKKVIELEKNQTEQNKKSMEYENKQKEEEQKLKQKLDLEQYKQLLEQQHSKILKLEQLLQEQVDKSVEHEERLSEISALVGLDQKFKMKNFSQVKAKGDIWKSPAMYTHLYGYKFCVQVNPNASALFGRDFMGVDLWILVGEFDDQLEWPSQLAFTIELVSQCGGENARSIVPQWRAHKPSGTGYNSGTPLSVKHSNINNFLKNDTLFFHISELKVL